MGGFAKLGLPKLGLPTSIDFGSAAGAAAHKGLQSMQSVASVGSKAKTIARSASQTISENAISRQRWMSFFSGVFAGSALMSLAFAFMPMIVFAPQKFALLFTLGSICFMCSFSILR